MIVPIFDLAAALTDREPTPLDAAEVKALAEPLAAEIATELLGNLNRKLSNGRQLRFGRHGSLTVDLRHGHSGRYFDHQEGEGGDIIRLVQRELGVDFPAALDWLAQRVGLEEMTPDDISNRIADRAALTAAQAAQEARERIERISAAADMWNASVLPSGTPVEVYLRNQRRCWQPWLSDGEAIRFNSKARIGGGFYPCMIVKMTDALTGKFTGVQRVHLLPDGSGKGAMGRRMLGPSRGAVVRLRWQPGPDAILAEGLENSISATVIDGTPSRVVGWQFGCNTTDGDCRVSLHPCRSRRRGA